MKCRAALGACLIGATALVPLVRAQNSGNAMPPPPPPP